MNHIVLAGGTVSIPGLAEEIEEQMGIPTNIANPFVNMSLSKRIESIKLTQDTASLMTCCGLALRRFD